MGTTFSITLPMERTSDSVLSKVSDKDVFRKYSHPAMIHRKSHDATRSSSRKDGSSKKSGPSMRQQGVLDSGVMGELQRQGSMESIQSIGFHHNLDDSGLDRESSISDLIWSKKSLRNDPLYSLPQPVGDTENENAGTTTTTTFIQTQRRQSNRGTINENVTNQMVKVPEKKKSLLPHLDEVANNNRLLPPDAMEEVVKYCILVVDDSPLNRKMLSKLLKSKGHHIEEAENGEMAVDKIKQEADAGRNYDVILMDYVMPVMDGPTATRAIRAMDIKTPIFGLTGNAIDTDIKIFLNAGADSVLIKPFSLVEFASAMASVALRMASGLQTGRGHI